jgi:DNA-binding NarL/FixJ family response regulator
MIDPINSSVSSLSAVGTQDQQSHRSEPNKTEGPKVEEGPAVDIELSDQTQAKILEGQGRTITEIALKLRLDELTVRSYLTDIA